MITFCSCPSEEPVIGNRQLLAVSGVRLHDHDPTKSALPLRRSPAIIRRPQAARFVFAMGDNLIYAAQRQRIIEGMRKAGVPEG
jgi:hypothetical protein